MNDQVKYLLVIAHKLMIASNWKKICVYLQLYYTGKIKALATLKAIKIDQDVLRLLKIDK